MIQRDYIMRTVQQIAHTLAALFGGRHGRRLAETMTRLDTLSATFTGLRLDTLRGVPYDDLRAILSVSGSLAVERAYAAARVLQADVALAQERGAGFSRAQAVTALRLLAETTCDLGGFVDDQHGQALAQLHDALRGSLGEDAAAEAAFQAWRCGGRFDRAEDALFEWLAADASARPTAEAFYRELLALPDEALERGGLPRSEVRDGLRELGLDPAEKRYGTAS